MKDAAPVAAKVDPIASRSVKDAALVAAKVDPIVPPPAKDSAPVAAKVDPIVPPPAKDAAPVAAKVESIAPPPVKDSALVAAKVDPIASPSVKDSAPVAAKVDPIVPPSVKEPLLIVAAEPETAAFIPPRKESFVSAAEKERMLRSIRDSAAKELEDKQALRARLEQVAATRPAEVTPTAVTPAEAVPVSEVATSNVITTDNSKAEVVAVETTITQGESAAAPIATVVPGLEEVAHPGTLVPPPARPTPASLRHKTEMRSATQTRINEAYLRQLKGEQPLVEVPAAVQASLPPPRRPSSQQPRNADGTRTVAVESLGEGVFNALGDLVGGVVQVGRVLGRGVKQVVAVDPVSHTSGTARMADKMAKGMRGVVKGAGAIVKGSGNIVVGAVGVVTLPVVEAVGAVIHSLQSSGQSSGSPAKTPEQQTAAPQDTRSDS